MSQNLQNTLSILANLITTNVKTLEAAYSSKNVPYPSLDDPFVLGPLDREPSLEHVRRTIVGAAAQIIAAVRLPSESMAQVSTSHYLSACLGAVTDFHVADIIEELRPEVSTIDERESQIT